MMMVILCLFALLFLFFLSIARASSLLSMMEILLTYILMFDLPESSSFHVPQLFPLNSLLTD
ncbi:hypothetical protein K474DRAFT_1662243 [Panus rudis PR-1116 ss-1]|nr:hypothetical protein K474DRAFT_1662243 [Panus rudis PR-1116 ss-1]